MKIRSEQRDAFAGYVPDQFECDMVTRLTRECPGQVRPMLASRPRGLIRRRGARARTDGIARRDQVTRQLERMLTFAPRGKEKRGRLS